MMTTVTLDRISTEQDQRLSQSIKSKIKYTQYESYQYYEHKTIHITCYDCCESSDLKSNTFINSQTSQTHICCPILFQLW